MFKVVVDRVLDRSIADELVIMLKRGMPDSMRAYVEEYEEDPLPPLVIVGFGGGLQQWEFSEPGVGKPEMHVLEYDLEGEPPERLAAFADEIDAAANALEARHPTSEWSLAGVRNLRAGAAEFRVEAALGHTGSRYR